MSVAIDGPAGAGKSTIAREVAKRLGYVYVDTGAMYRAIGLFVLENNIDINDSDVIVSRLDEVNVELGHVDGVQHIYLNGRDVSDDIRSTEVGMAASRVSAVPQVRTFLLDLQRNIAKTKDVVMDGRDIGTVILPDAKVKIFLTASAEERARRRYEEYMQKGDDISFEKVLATMKKRDYDDSTRAASPLKQADDAVLVDTTGKKLKDSINIIFDLIKELI